MTTHARSKRHRGSIARVLAAILLLSISTPALAGDPALWPYGKLELERAAPAPSSSPELAVTFPGLPEAPPAPAPRRGWGALKDKSFLLHSAGLATAVALDITSSIGFNRRENNPLFRNDAGRIDVPANAVASGGLIAFGAALQYSGHRRAAKWFLRIATAVRGYGFVHNITR